MANNKDVYFYFKQIEKFHNQNNLEKALNIADEAIENFPFNEVLYGSRGEVFMSLKQTDEAIQDYETAIQLGMDKVVFHNLGVCYLSKKDFNQAIEYFTECIKAEQANFNTYLARAEAYQAINKEDLALEDFDSAIQLKAKELGFDKEQKCELHNKKLDIKRVAWEGFVNYSRPNYSLDEYSVAKRRFFPNLETFIPNSSFVAEFGRTFEIYAFCPECRDMKNAWITNKTDTFYEEEAFLLKKLDSLKNSQDEGQISETQNTLNKLRTLNAKVIAVSGQEEGDIKKSRKIIKFCLDCEESFAERFSLCPNCGKKMKTFETKSSEVKKTHANKPNIDYDVLTEDLNILQTQRKEALKKVVLDRLENKTQQNLPNFNLDRESENKESTDELKRINSLKFQLMQNLEWKSVKDIPNFPFASFKEVQKKVQKKVFTIGIDYTISNELARWLYGKTYAIFIGFLLTTPILISILLLINAIFWQNYWLLFGIPLTLFGFVTGSVYRNRNNLISILLVISLIISLVGGFVTIGVLIAIFLLPRWLNTFVTHQNQDKLIDVALNSEIILIGLYQLGHLGFRENETGNSYWNKESIRKNLLEFLERHNPEEANKARKVFERNKQEKNENEFGENYVEWTNLASRTVENGYLTNEEVRVIRELSIKNDKDTFLEFLQILSKRPPLEP